jgi:hypothetical protein
MSELSDTSPQRGPSGAGEPRPADAIAAEVLAGLRRRWERADLLTPAEAVAAGALAPEAVAHGPAARLPAGARILRVERSDPAAGLVAAAVPLAPERLTGSDPATLVDALDAELRAAWAAARTRAARPAGDA